ncbi:hypothetical protein M404DRAFT_160930, partial [Pisolithus tinctorius Marx 270]
FVLLEEQLAIFLYMSVTGLTIRHVSEHFQWSNETISQYFCKMLFILLLSPFYSTCVKMPGADDIQPKIRGDKRFWLYFKDAIGALDGSHIQLLWCWRTRWCTETAKAPYCRTACLLVISS